MQSRPNEGDTGPRLNSEIRAPRVRLIDETGRQLGEFLTRDAVRIAEERGLDLVEVSPGASPPVCRIADYGKLKYAKSKASKDNRKSSSANQVKEVRFRPATDVGDFDTKVRKIIGFIAEGKRVKVEVRFQRRELRSRHLGEEKIRKVIEATSAVARVDGTVSWQGNSITALLTPNEK